jgi:3-methylfumaryl-CoA hydratase
VLLFRYSALTFNSHRIHYDRTWATQTEGYAGLVVHGPLVATLLLDLVARMRERDEVSRFAFRAVSPAFADEPLVLLGRPDDGGHILLSAQTLDGRVVMQADADAAPASGRVIRGDRQP